MHAHHVNTSSDHYPQNASGNRFFFVGDGCEVLFAARTEIECLDEARRLNREGDTDMHGVYCADIDQMANGRYVFAHERECVRELGL